MNVIDALVITLGLDPKGFEKGRKDVDSGMKDLREKSAKTAKEMEEQGKKAAAFFSSVKVELLGLLAAFGAASGLKEFIGTSVTGQAALGRMSKNLDINARRLEAWGVVAKEMGGNAQDAFGALQAVASGIAEAQIKGTSAFTNAARMNGVALTDQKGKLLNTDQILVSISRRMQSLPRQQALWLANQLGVGAMFNQLMLGPEELERRLAAAQRMSGVTDKSIKGAQQLQKAWADLGERIKSASDTMFAKLEPVLIRLGNEFADWLDSVDWNKVANQIVALAKSVNDVVQKFGGWKTVVIALGVILGAKLLAPIVSIVAGLGGMGGGILRLIGMTGGVRGLGAAFAGLGISIAAAAAAYAGWKIGSAIYEHYIKGTKADSAIGGSVAQVMALLGDQDAQDALDRAHGKGSSNHSGDFHPERTQFFKDRQAKAMKFFMDQGWSRAQAAGIVANISKESGFHENRFGDHGHAFGLSQWHKDRQAEFAKYMGRSIVGSSFEDQLAFINYELTHNEKRAGDLLRKASSAGAAGMVVSLDYERPANAQSEAMARGKLANDIYLGGIKVGAASVASAKQASAGTTNTSTTQTNINGPITVNTKATDANGIARDLHTSLANNAVVAQANTGLN